VDWVPLNQTNTLLILGAAGMVMGGYVLSVMVMRVGEISFVAPFRYTGLIWALTLGWFVFGDWPRPLTLIGAAIVVGSGVFMLYRERQLAQRIRQKER
jgi:S-adenosylmethionine uptake transporter